MVHKHFYTIAFTHRNMDVSQIGRLHIEEQHLQERFSKVKADLSVSEVLFLSTCNRVEFFVLTERAADADFLSTFFSGLYPGLSDEMIAYYTANADVQNGQDAVEHVLRVASSIDSLVIGEREIITQVRHAQELSARLGLSGDFIRLLIRHTIQTAKQVYTQTKISQKPVSVVSIAYQRLQGMEIPSDARVLVIGAGVTNTAMCRFLKKHGMTQFVVFNRTFEKALSLAGELGGEAYPLSKLEGYQGGFDVLVTCTGSQDAIIDETLYAKLLQGDDSPKVTIDLALPNDIAPEVHHHFATRQISINVLQAISDNHLKERSLEIAHVEEIISVALTEFKLLAREREIEIAMRPVPQMVREIRETAFNSVFKSELESLDEHSKQLLEKVVGYMEKKYMSMPMKMAKEILIKS
jgi:glutamyl-tRNA reductase